MRIILRYQANEKTPHQIRTYRSIAAASGYARSMVGKHPTLKDDYATKDGIDRLRCVGCLLTHLFPTRTID